MDAVEPTFDFGITDLEEALRGPEGAALQAQLAARLEALGQAQAEAMRGGLAPEAYEEARRLGEALAAARDVVIRFPVG